MVIYVGQLLKFARSLTHQSIHRTGESKHFDHILPNDTVTSFSAVSSPFLPSFVHIFQMRFVPHH